MPKRTDIKKILIIGSGPIVIGQACEFDYSGTQACKALKQEGYQVILVNSNPATIMTDPEMADRTYIEPITVDFVTKIIEKEKPDALLPTLGGQTGLNIAVQLAEQGVLEENKVEMIGAKLEAIKKAEDRGLFKKAMQKIGLDLPQSGVAHSKEEALAIAEKLGFPVVVRAAFTLGGAGGGIAYNIEELEEIVTHGLELSMVHEVLIEESVIGWKEFELEVMRDLADNVVIICSIENFDPMGVHTGDSITVAPAQTLTDKEYQRMRDAAIRCIREIGVETGGSNIQFAVHPENGRMVIIEMNPRVSRSSALASKVTGFPIAKIAAKLAVGYTLDEIPNDITQKTPACFEPAIDYCVVKIPRFAFEKFPGAKPVLGIRMQSVGETMAIGRTFKEALQKALRGLEIGRGGLENSQGMRSASKDMDLIREKIRTPNPDRVFYIKDALTLGVSIEEIYDLSKIDPWFLHQMKEIVDCERELISFHESKTVGADPRVRPSEGTHMGVPLLWKAKQHGFSDEQIAEIWGKKEEEIRQLRKEHGVVPRYGLVDTCAGEFEAYTPYYYSTYEKDPINVGADPRVRPSEGTHRGVPLQGRSKIMILGGGPNRIGQGIEFDYCCVHASFALKELGYETIMVNSNPETVSTDYDISDRLYFESLTIEDVLNIIDHEKPAGVIVQFGGQTPLNLARALEQAGAPIIGTSVDSIDRAEDRDRFQQMIRKLGLVQPKNAITTTIEGAKIAAKEIGYPVIIRPSYVLGGRAMEIVYDDISLDKYVREAARVSGKHPILVDQYIEDAYETDVDLVSDGEIAVIGAVMEHIEEAGIHSGDSACVIPPYSLGREIIDEIRRCTYVMAKELKVIGLMNVQFAIKNNTVYVLEVNPRASRTVPFVSKSIGIPLAKLAAKVMIGVSLRDLGFTQEIKVDHVSVKESVLPFARFPGVDIILGPEMHSTGEVMGIDTDFGKAFAKSQIAAGQPLNIGKNVFVSVMDKDKRAIPAIAKKLVQLGFQLIATKGTAAVLEQAGLEVKQINKLIEGRPHIGDLIRNGEIHLIINTPSGKGPMTDEGKIRALAVSFGIPCITTIAGAQATVKGIETIQKDKLGVKAIQDYHRKAESGKRPPEAGSPQAKKVESGK